MGTPIHLIGVPTDVHSSFLRGPAKAPAEIRAMIFSPHSNFASERGLEMGEDIELIDEGDLLLRELPTDDAVIAASNMTILQQWPRRAALRERSG